MTQTNHMEQRVPLKRSEALKPLSRDHHEGLLLCWKIRKGIKDRLDSERIASYVMVFFEKALQPHFNEEERFVFSLLPETEEHRNTAVQLHRALKQCVEDVSQNSDNCHDLLMLLADELEQHIRFEERILFPFIEQTVTDGLQDAGKVIAARHEHLKPIDWDDQFWM